MPLQLTLSEYFGNELRALQALLVLTNAAHARFISWKASDFETILFTHDVPVSAVHMVSVLLLCEIRQQVAAWRS